MILMKKMLLLLFLCGLSWGTVHAASILNRAEFITSREDAALMPGEMRFERSYDLGGGQMMPVVVEVTAKGNGMMRALDAEFPVCDVHDDGNVFRGGMLDVELVDVDEDGCKDLVVTGIVDTTDEKSGKVVASKALVAIFHCDPVKRVMRLRFFSGPEYLREWFQDRADKPKQQDLKAGH